MARTIIKHFLSNIEDTEILGKQLAKQLKENSLISFFGSVGVGKTTLIKSIVSSLGFEKAQVTSPTFNYLNIYETPIPVYHFDLYRLNDQKDFLARGFDEYFENYGICLIEWAEKIEPILPAYGKKIFLSHLSNEGRLCEIH